MAKHRKNKGNGRIGGIILLAVAYLTVLIVILLQGQNVAIFNPKGLIASEQLRLTILSVGIMLVIAIPTLGVLYFTAWRYRESNPKPKRDLKTNHDGKLFNAGMWLTPFVFMIVLVGIMLPATHKLEPQKQIKNGAEPLTIQVVAMRWKWLFIYPDQKIATVNYVQLPIDTPVTFELTADEVPMSSFWIPNLGGMLYAMTGHTNRLNLMADTLGEYPGSSAEINGAGFAGMKFVAHATSKEDFDMWVRGVSLSSDTLTSAEYDELLKPSENNPIASYSVADNDLYAKVLMKYNGAHAHAEAQPEPYHGADH